MLFALLQSCYNGELINPEKSDSYYLKNGKIYYIPSGNAFELGSNECKADIKSFEVLSKYYAKDKNYIYYQHSPIDVDFNSFYLDKGVPKDKDYVYKIIGIRNYKVEPLGKKEIDVESFQYLTKDHRFTEWWSKDKNSYYYKGKKVDLDYETITFLGRNFVYDKDSLYTYLNKKLTAILGLQSKPRLLTPNYVYIQNKVVYKTIANYRDTIRKNFAIIHTDLLNTFKELSHHTIVFNDDVIYYGVKIPHIDGETCTVFYSEYDLPLDRYLIDKTYAYFDLRELPNADVSTLRYIDDFYVKDKKNVYYKDMILQDADSRTFRKHNKRYDVWIDDKGNTYKHGKVIK